MSKLTIPFQYADSLPLVPSEGTIAYIIDVATGELYVEAGNFETAISYIQTTEYIAIACADEVHVCRQDDCLYCETYGPIVRTQADLQASFDHERRLQEDCFNLVAVAA